MFFVYNDMLHFDTLSTVSPQFWMTAEACGPQFALPALESGLLRLQR